MSDHKSLAQALAAAQAEITDPIKSKTATAGSYSYTYTDIAGVLEVVRPVLSKHGIAVHQGFEPIADGRGFVLTTTLMHGNEELRSALPWILPNDPQKLGSAITYLRRYALCAAVGVAADSDDDGAAAKPATPQRPPQTRKQNNGGSPDCPKCGGAMYDNRADKANGRANPKSPDFKCKDRDCAEPIWVRR